MARVDGALAGGALTVKAAAKDLSDTLTELWDKNWNVFIGEVYSYVLPDGFAYNSHWYFHHNFLGYARSYVMFKDYNGYSAVNFDMNDAMFQSSTGQETAIYEGIRDWHSESGVSFP